MKMKQHIEGIDYLRALMSFFVVAWHMEGGGRSLIWSKTEYSNHSFTFSDFINFHVLLLAVPIFILISNYIFSLKERDFEYLKRRLVRLFLILSFWQTALILWRWGHAGFYKIIPDSLPSFLLMVIRGGTGIYYFFVCLMLTLSATYFIAKCRTVMVAAGFIVALSGLFLLPALTKLTAFYPLSAYWSPLNFMPFPFAAVLLVRLSEVINRRRTLLFISAVILALIFSVIEWNIHVAEIFFKGGGYAIPTYARLSVLFSSIAFLVIALHPGIRSYRIVKFMSKHALTLYCLHIFFFVDAKNLAVRFMGAHFAAPYVATAVLILFCYAISVVLSFYIKKEIIR